jgi:hypothetical protein
MKQILKIFIFSFIIFSFTACQKLSTNTVQNQSQNQSIDIPEGFFVENVKVPGIDNSNTQILKKQLITNAIASSTIPDQNNGDTAIVLGQQLPNPYTVSNMQQAWNLLYGNTTTLTANYNYIKIKPSSIDQLSTLLEDSTIELQDYPMDYDVLQEGDYYQDPSLGTEDMPYLYASVPVNYAMPAGISYQILAQLYVPPTDNLLLEDMAESLVNGATYAAAVSSNNRIITRTDIKAGSSLIIPMVLLCADGYHWDYTLKTCVPNNCPIGYQWDGTKCVPIVTPPPPVDSSGIYVEDQVVFGQPSNIVPLRQVHVICKRWFKFWRGYTNDQGKFNCTKTFRNKVKVIVKTENSYARIAKVRGIRLWQLLLPCRKRLGVYAGSELSTLRYVFTKPTDGSANNANLPYWAATTTHNSVVEFRTYAAELGLPNPPNNLKIIVTNWGFERGAAGTPMFNKCHNDFIPVGFATYFIANSNYVSAGITLLANTLKNQIDMIIGYAAFDYNAGLTSHILKTTVYHELSHAQHFTQAGCNFWTAYRNAIITELVNSLGKDPYGNGTNASTAPIIGTGEMWGYGMEKIYAERYYGNGGGITGFVSLSQGWSFNNGYISGLNANYSAIESFNPNLASDNYRWIPAGLPYDLWDNRVDIGNGVIDNVSGYSFAQCFNALQSDVSSITAFRDRLLQQNGNSQQSQVTQLFKSYGY